MIDLHCHSTASDGVLSPKELITYAKEQGIDLLCLTDHDTTSGLKQAYKTSKKLGMGFLGGIELDINYSIGEFHLLGIGLQDWDGSMQDMLKDVQLRREHRNVKMIRRFQEDGFDVDWSSLKKIAGNRLIGRPHFAQLLVQRGIVKNTQAAFDKFLTYKSPYYSAKEGVDLDVAIDWIQKAGGVPIIAHPMSLFLGWEKLTDYLKQWIPMGIKGLEAYHSGAKLRHCHRLASLADEFNILITAGSDYHGPGRKDRKLGYTAGLKKIDELLAKPFEQLILSS